MSIAERRIVPELLDQAPDDEAAASLQDLVKINRYLGGYLTLRSLMARVAPRGDRFSLLDVGAATGDMGAKIRTWYPKVEVTCFDYKFSHVATAPGLRVVGDAFSLPFAPASFDFVFSSLFLHHFDDDAIVQLLSEFRLLARKAVLTIDLERGPFAYRFIPRTRWLFGWAPITLHDAPASVASAFEAAELAALAERAGLINPEVRVHRPWARLSLAARTR
jgi:SAM-dependent methyltransferase